MATIRLIEEHEASPEVKTIYDEVKKYFDLDFVPNVFKALANNPDNLKQQWEGFKQSEDQWVKEIGKETLYLLYLAVDVANRCDYCINFDTALLKQLGWDDKKIERLMNLIGTETYFNTYVDGLRLEPDVTPEVLEKKKAA